MTEAEIRRIIREEIAAAHTRFLADRVTVNLEANIDCYNAGVAAAERALTMTMQEKVARVLFLLMDTVDPEKIDVQWRNLGPLSKEARRDDALDVLRALREPTPEMVAAGQRVGFGCAPQDYYEAMIDAALNSP